MCLHFNFAIGRILEEIAKGYRPFKYVERERKQESEKKCSQPCTLPQQENFWGQFLKQKLNSKSTLVILK